MAQAIASKAGVTDVREVRFGEGKTALIAQVKKNPPRGVVIATAAGLSGDVVEALLPVASVVVRPTR
jgi:hypothetical protein